MTREQQLIDFLAQTDGTKLGALPFPAMHPFAIMRGWNSRSGARS
ncbi:hypothetical protein [Iodidimonas nitroreducens]|nr:hypothetical protein [Iodidimonas nitroreducens]